MKTGITYPLLSLSSDFLVEIRESTAAAALLAVVLGRHEVMDELFLRFKRATVSTTTTITVSTSTSSDTNTHSVDPGSSVMKALKEMTCVVAPTSPSSPPSPSWLRNKSNIHTLIRVICDEEQSTRNGYATSTTPTPTDEPNHINNSNSSHITDLMFQHIGSFGTILY